MESYSDKLLRKIRSDLFQCQALENDGSRCKKNAHYEVTISVDPETRKVNY